MMEMVMKTKTVSEQLGVNPTTVQRWVKHFKIDCQKNEHGHYLFTEHDVHQLKQIKEQLDAGLLMNDIQLRTAQEARYKEEEKPFDQRFNHLLDQLDRLEKKIEQKADDVLSYQVLQHASEMDEMMKRLVKIEEKIEDLEVQLLKLPEREMELAAKPKRNWLVSLFTF
ncbi:chromosome-anchoring protein RacA [Fictibacillus sp. Mic-4]|uniref:chromosome-anchoring protein RacA n=1 Tax=Fictibacillus TaxID=1329200 RepID=UPI000405967E|nr:chromosome-anchoring protein RacA [Fictibacillus gelatini]